MHQSYRTTSRFSILIFLLPLAIGLQTFAQEQPRSKGENVGEEKNPFDRDIAPILIKRCLECHNTTEQSGSLDLTTAKTFRDGGESGESLFTHDLDENYLLDRVSSGEMPPKLLGVSKKLPDAEIATLSKWIQNGAKWPADRKLDLYEFTNEIRGGRDWWSFQSIRSPQSPKFQPAEKADAPDLNQNPIDAFIARSLKQKNLTFAPSAANARLFRRVAFDVTGLPPGFDEVIEYSKNDSPVAYSQLVDQLLNSPRFGEHFGRRWLDLVRYADTNGYERDAEKKHAWKYRDYVIESINSDRPYNNFVKQQLAGDQIQPQLEENIIATTMLRLGTFDDEPNDKLEYKYDRLEDLIHVTSTAFLGLTVKCARCHDHKFDPIPQTDYYQTAAIFWPGDLIGNATEKVNNVDAFAWTDQTTNPSPIHLLKKGNPRDPAQKVSPRFLSVVKELDTDFVKPSSEKVGTGRRLEFAKRIVDPKNPLTARVIVNRVWQHYFGHGLVRSVNNFGYKGDLPTHPELLDWLAAELIRNNWNLKSIHRLILTSRTYRQDTVHPNAQKMLELDPLNKMLWRMNRRRLGAESIRDTFLSLSGQLNLQMNGRGFTPEVSAAALEGLSRRSSAWTPSTADQKSRRGVYMYLKRSLIPPLIANFDFADTTRPCGQRDFTIVAPQALALMNNQFAHAQSELFASRVIHAKESAADRVAFAIASAFGRTPTANEIEKAKFFIAQQQEEFQKQSSSSLSPEQLAYSSFCHVLLNSNELIFVD